jgi:transposase
MATDEIIELIRRGVSIKKIAEHYGVSKKSISVRVSRVIPGGIRKLRQNYPLNRDKNVEEE